MAFSFRKIISNISYFKKEGETDIATDQQNKHAASEPAEFIPKDCAEPDSTSLKLPNSLKRFTTINNSLSDTNLLSTEIIKDTKAQRKAKKLKVDIKKANISTDDEKLHRENVENTPKQLLLDCKSAEEFSERLKKFDFDRSFDLFDEMSDEDISSPSEEQLDIESLSSDSEASADETDVKMCRKVEESAAENQLASAMSLESFGDMELDKNDEERLKILLDYQSKLAGMEDFLKKLFTEFHFHIEVSKILQCRSVTPVSNNKGKGTPLSMGDYLIDKYRGISPSGSWNIVLEKEDDATKLKFEHQLLSIKQIIDEFIEANLKSDQSSNRNVARKSITYKRQKSFRANKKRVRHFDFPDYREALLSLFSEEDSKEDTNSSLLEENVQHKCSCNCHGDSPSSESDSGLTTKSTERSMSITSSIGNFTLDSSTLTAYSESLDQIISYNSFQDTSLYSTLLQKVAIERITFYVQVHSIQIKVEMSDDFESKNVIIFHCPACSTTESDEHGLLKHILSQYHCEKIHFLYKTIYIKKCVQSGTEIQPSTVLNPMKMYRDDNKIVCFGDAVYACSLCFENLIVGESVLMAHCNSAQHVDRREKIHEILN